MLIAFLQKNRITRKIIRCAGSHRARGMVREIEPFLNEGDKITDIGSGTCNVCEILRENGHDTTALDIENLSFVDGVEPVVYDGSRIPFENEEFDVSIIITVLHHVPDPESLLNEAARVSKRVIITEDTYKGRLHKYLTWFFDSLINLEFSGHPHTNRTDEHWKETFSRLGLKLMDERHRRSLLVFAHSTYHLTKA